MVSAKQKCVFVGTVRRRTLVDCNVPYKWVHVESVVYNDRISMFVQSAPAFLVIRSFQLTWPFLCAVICIFRWADDIRVSIRVRVRHVSPTAGWRPTLVSWECGETYSMYLSTSEAHLNSFFEEGGPCASCSCSFLLDRHLRP